MAVIELTITCQACGAVCRVYPENVVPQLSCANCRRAFDITINRIPGFVYVLSNTKMPGLLKIGYTERTVEERAEELTRHTGVPGRFQIDAYFASEAPQADEARVHLLLANHRDSADREFFAVDLPNALSAITEVCGRPPCFLHDCPPSRSAQAADNPTTRSERSHEFRVLQCQDSRCRQRLRIPSSTSDVRVTCTSCGRRFIARPTGETMLDRSYYETQASGRG